MARFVIEIEVENDAFQGGQARDEVARILRELAHDIDQIGVETVRQLHDINGNRVGDAYLKGTRP